PCADDEAARIGVAADHVDDIGHLVDGAAVGGRPRAPLPSVHRAEVAALVRPFVPDGDAVLVEVADIGVAGEKPQQLVNDGFQVHFLGRQQREAGRKIEAHLVAEHGQRAGAGAVMLLRAVAQDALHQVEVLAHGVLPRSESPAHTLARASPAAKRCRKRAPNSRLDTAGSGASPPRVAEATSLRRLAAAFAAYSTNTSSRRLRSIGRAASTSRRTAIPSSVPEIGRVMKTLTSPRAISMA